VSTIADNLQAAAPSWTVTITPVCRLVRIDVEDRSRVITTEHAARILAAIRAGMDPAITLRTVK
jgi:hypothetical protein